KRRRLLEMMKKMPILGLLLGLTIGMLGACGNQEEENSSTGYVPEALTVQFVPSQNADTLEAKAKPLERLLSDRLGIPVKVSVSTNYNTIIEAMASKQVDV